MALENSDVLKKQTIQLDQTTEQIATLTNTRIRLLGAIEVLQQIEESKLVKEEPATEEVSEDSFSDENNE